MSDSYKPPVALNAPKSSVEKFAEKFAEEIGFSAGSDIEDLVRQAGGRLIVGTSGAEDIDSGSIIARDVDDFEIFVSRHTSLKRDRFTIAHELGHLLLHFRSMKKREPNVVMRATRYVDKEDQAQMRAEWEANWFAAGFLMPSGEFENAHKEGGVDKAARVCGVSRSAAEIRAKNLGLD